MPARFYQPPSVISFVDWRTKVKSVRLLVGDNASFHAGRSLAADHWPSGDRPRPARYSGCHRVRRRARDASPIREKNSVRFQSWGDLDQVWAAVSASEEEPWVERQGRLPLDLGRPSGVIVYVNYTAQNVNAGRLYRISCQA
jgi:hypothetical protein